MIFFKIKVAEICQDPWCHLAAETVRWLIPVLKTSYCDNKKQFCIISFMLSLFFCIQMARNIWLSQEGHAQSSCHTCFHVSTTLSMRGTQTVRLPAYCYSAQWQSEKRHSAYQQIKHDTQHSDTQHSGRMLVCFVSFRPSVLYAKCNK